LPVDWVDTVLVTDDVGRVTAPALRRRTLAIVGSHPATRELAPYDDPEIDILLFNEAAQKPEVYRRWDMLLQIHAPEVYRSPENWVNAEHWRWLQQEHGKPIWMQEVDPEVPDSVRYPLEEILAMVPYRYLRSSPAMALALAIWMGYETVELYGSELTSNTEYSYQACNYAFWIGFAHGRGIDLQLRCWESEFFQPIYGYEGEFQLEQDFFARRFRENEEAWNKSEWALKKLKDQIGEAMLKNQYEKVASLSLDLEMVAQTAGEAAGAMAEAERYSLRSNPISRQEFERTSARAQNEYNEKLQAMYHAAGKCEYVWNAWRLSGDLRALNQLRTFLDEKLTAAYDCGARQGIYRENIGYMVKYDILLTAAGGVRALGRPVPQEVEAM